ncbi:MAG: hypothetical protein H7839_10745 [Magnetococcus sp. YQC-5]
MNVEANPQQPQQPQQAPVGFFANLIGSVKAEGSKMGTKASLGALVALISDFLQPLAPFSKYILFGAVIVAVALFVLSKIATRTEKFCAPLIATCFIMMFVSGGLLQLQGKDGDKKGFLASSIPGIDKLQESIGIIGKDVADIKKNTEEIKESSSQIAKNTKEMSEGINALGKIGGLISAPKTSSEFYHNARIFAQKGENDQALDSYKKLFALKIREADPIMDFTELLIAAYGVNTAKDVIKDTFEKENKELMLFAIQNLNDAPLDEIMELILDKKATYPPMVLAWTGKQLLTLFNYNPPTPVLAKCAYYIASEFLEESINKGDFYKYYIDKLRVKQSVETQKMNWGSLKTGDEFKNHRVYDFSRQVRYSDSQSSAKFNCDTREYQIPISGEKRTD